MTYYAGALVKYQVVTLGKTLTCTQHMENKMEKVPMGMKESIRNNLETTAKDGLLAVHEHHERLSLHIQHLVVQYHIDYDQESS